MTGPLDKDSLKVERGCALTAVALSDRRRDGVVLVTGEQRGFGLDPTLKTVRVPWPPSAPDWSRRTLTCGIALQCAPSKERLTEYRLHGLSGAELRALATVEAEVALGWIGTRWPGLVPEIRRVVPDLAMADADTGAPAMIERAVTAAATGRGRAPHPLLGRLPIAHTHPRTVTERLRRSFGRMPWTSTQKRLPRPYSTPVGGDGGVRNPNLPPPSRPQDNDLDRTPEHRPGIPYPEWNMWTRRFMPGHVAVLEQAHHTTPGRSVTVTADLRGWFEQHTHRALAGGLEDGSDLDVDRYVRHHVDLTTGSAGEPRIFRELMPRSRDVATALLLDGSSSLGVHGGQIFRLELACADALSHALRRARQRHGIFVFTGNTRHRVEVRRLKDFGDARFTPPGGLGLETGGYTRLGAPLRHLTARLLAQPAEHRLLIVLGDGLISDEGYEGRYAWADTAHAVQEANEAGVTVYYIGIGPVRVDPLPEVFGPRRSQRIGRVEDLPRVLAHVHRELVTA